MKLSRLSIAVVLLMLALVSVINAQETISLEPISRIPSEPERVSSPFTTIVHPDSELVPEPGPANTEKGNYEGMTLPYLISTPKPIPYPRWAVRQGWEGKMSIAIEVLTDGTVGRYQVMESTGYSLLDETATKAVLGWKFHPAMEQDKAVLTCIEIPIFFRLKED